MAAVERFEHCIVEWYWSPPATSSTQPFEPSFTVFFAGGQAESYVGGNAELATFFSKMGHEGWRIATALTSANWILWTLERKLS